MGSVENLSSCEDELLRNNKPMCLDINGVTIRYLHFQPDMDMYFVDEILSLYRYYDILITIIDVSSDNSYHT